MILIAFATMQNPLTFRPVWPGSLASTEATVDNSTLPMGFEGQAVPYIPILWGRNTYLYRELRKAKDSAELLHHAMRKRKFHRAPNLCVIQELIGLYRDYTVSIDLAHLDH